MSARDLARYLAGVMESPRFVADDPAERLERVQDFEDAGICTAAEGLVISTEAGAEYQILVVQTRQAPRDHRRWLAASARH